MALGLRLALTRDGRRRTVLTAVACGLGTVVFLVVLAIAHADRVRHPERYLDAGMDRAIGAIVVVIGVQVAALAATAGRLAAGLRTRRLRNLRLVGLPMWRTRLVAATETAVAAMAGCVVGVVVFEPVRAMVAAVTTTSSWSYQVLEPGWVGRLVTVIAVVGFTVVLATLPDRLDARRSLTEARGTTATRPAWWRVVPLVVGAAGCVWFRANPWNEGQIPLMAGSILALGVGVILVVPLFVRMVADLLVRLGRGGPVTIAGRRLQAQPSSMNRVITGLLLGLFLVTGARLVVVAFESTPQYRGAAFQVEHQQLVQARVAAEDVNERVRLAESLKGVRSVVPVPEIALPCSGEGWCLTGWVISCTDLAAIHPSIQGCHGDRAQILNGTDTMPIEPAASVTAISTDLQPIGPPVDITVSEQPVTVAETDGTGAILLIVPPTVPGVDQIVASAGSHTVLIVGDAGRDLGPRLTAAGFSERPWSSWDPSDYDLVAGIRLTVVAVGITVIAIGLLAFAVAAIDRAMARRRDAVALQLVGVPGSVLRRVQWIETATPVIGGSALAIGAGLLGGSAYLGLDDLAIPWRSIAVLAASATLGGLIVSGITISAANPRIDPETIRRT